MQELIEYTRELQRQLQIPHTGNFSPPIGGPLPKKKEKIFSQQ